MRCFFQPNTIDIVLIPPQKHNYGMVNAGFQALLDKKIRAKRGKGGRGGSGGFAPQSQSSSYNFNRMKNKSCHRTASLPAGYILYCNIFIIKPYNIGHTDLDVFVCKSFCHIDIIIQV